MTGSRAPVAARPLAIWVALITVYIVWGSTYLAIRVVVETAPDAGTKVSMRVPKFHPGVRA